MQSRHWIEREASCRGVLEEAGPRRLARHGFQENETVSRIDTKTWRRQVSRRAAMQYRDLLLYSVGQRGKVYSLGNAGLSTTATKTCEVWIRAIGSIKPRRGWQRGTCHGISRGLVETMSPSDKITACDIGETSQKSGARRTPHNE